MYASDKTVSLFTYGTLMLPEIIQLITGRQCSGEKATLADFRRGKIRDESYPGIVRAPGHRVEGILYVALHTEEINRLSAFEGDAYELTRVKVQLPDGREADCLTYILKEKYLFLLTGETWSPENFIRDHKESFLREYEGWQYL
jgi:gamma-glutamylcyclotransferase (GGCT)/AIG2-like uncharacterized protein YtfP